MDRSTPERNSNNNFHYKLGSVLLVILIIFIVFIII